MTAPSEEESKSHVRHCPDCGMAVAPGQRRCTNCGASVDTHKRLPRRTPLVAALAVVVVSGGAVVVAQAAVTEKASIDASAPADVASAPVSVVGTTLPPPRLPTSTLPESSTPPAATTPSSPDITIPTSPVDLLKAAEKARQAAEKAAKEAAAKEKKQQSEDGTNLPDDTTPTTPDLLDPKRIKVVHTANYSPLNRAGVEFSKPKAAVDKRLRTVWDVNIPADGQPFDVGIILDLGEVHHVSSLLIRTPTPKFGAVIYRSDSDTVPDTLDGWTKAATIDSVSDDLTVPITEGDPEWARYILVYLTTPIAADNTRAAISDLEVLP